jgi:hypothetical protein
MKNDIAENGTQPEPKALPGEDSVHEPVRQFSQDGYAIVENRTAALPITLGFELTTWEAKRRMEEMRSKVGSEFFQEIQIVRATLTFYLSNVPRQQSPESEAKGD